MTAPRDPIEAPAQYEQQLRRLFAEAGPKDDEFFQPVADGLLTGALAAARDEGRQEAVQAVTPALTAIHQSSSDPRSVELAGSTLAFITDGLARHGRSSDPEPAPLDVERLAVAIRLESIRNMQPLSIEAARLYAHAVEGEYARLTGAVPALQATGEPPEDKCQKCNKPYSSGSHAKGIALGGHQHWFVGAGATGEGERHE